MPEGYSYLTYWKPNFHSERKTIKIPHAWPKYRDSKLKLRPQMLDMLDLFQQLWSKDLEKKRTLAHHEIHKFEKCKDKIGNFHLKDRKNCILNRNTIAL